MVLNVREVENVKKDAERILQILKREIEERRGEMVEFQRLKKVQEEILKMVSEFSSSQNRNGNK